MERDCRRRDQESESLEREFSIQEPCEDHGDKQVVVFWLRSWVARKVCVGLVDGKNVNALDGAATEWAGWKAMIGNACPDSTKRAMWMERVTTGKGGDWCSWWDCVKADAAD